MVNKTLLSKIIALSCFVVILSVITVLVSSKLTESYDDKTRVFKTDEKCRNVIAGTPALPTEVAKTLNISNEALTKILPMLIPAFKNDKCSQVGCIVPMEILPIFEYDTCSDIAGSQEVEVPNYNANGCILNFTNKTIFTEAINQMTSRYRDRQDRDVKQAQSILSNLQNSIRILNTSNATLLNECNTIQSSIDEKQITIKTKEGDIPALESRVNIAAATSTQTVEQRSRFSNNVNSMANNAILRYVSASINEQQSRLWQRRFSSKMASTDSQFVLAYKYAANTNIEYDPYDLWRGTVSDPQSMDDNSKYLANNISHRNSTVFSSVLRQGIETEVIIEVYDSKELYRNERIGWMNFTKPANANSETWFAKENYRKGTLNLEGDYLVFSIAGRDGRRWFISKGYTGCEHDPASLVIPTKTWCAWDKNGRRKIIMTNIPVLRKKEAELQAQGLLQGTNLQQGAIPYNMGGWDRTYYGIPLDDTNKFSVGDIMYVWVKVDPTNVSWNE